MTKKEEWLAGTRSAVPIMLGYVPVGIAYGVMARQAGLNTWQTVQIGRASCRERV